MNHSEKVAKLVVEAVLPGSKMDYRPEQSNGEYDFCLIHQNGKTYPLEVTSSIDEARIHTNARILDKKKGGSAVQGSTCQRNWMVFPAKDADIREIRKSVDRYLSRLESANIDRFYFTDAYRFQCVREICADLRIVSGSIVAFGRPQEIRIGLVGGGGAVDARLAVEAGEKEAWKDDNRKKLGGSDAEERHFVVYVSVQNGLPWTALTSFEPPPTLAKLPDEITHMWLIGENESPEDFIAWSAGRGEPWRRHTVKGIIHGAAANASTC